MTPDAGERIGARNVGFRDGKPVQDRTAVGVVGGHHVPTVVRVDSGRADAAGFSPAVRLPPGRGMLRAVIKRRLRTRDTWRGGLAPS